MELRLHGDYDGKGRPIWVVAAERSDAGRFIVHADQELPAFLELESAIRGSLRIGLINGRNFRQTQRH
jgi:hypothetical protein